MKSSVKISLLKDSDQWRWDQYITSCSKSTLYHLSAWKKIIEQSYGHKAYYLMAERENIPPSTSQLIGVLPLIHLKHFFFGNNLISLPFLDCSGMLANDEKTEYELFLYAKKIAHTLKAKLEIRQMEPIRWLTSNSINKKNGVEVKTHKVAMICKLPKNSEILMKSFKSKLRRQKRKPIKANPYRSRV